MTAPVAQTLQSDNSRVVSFVMPAEYTLSTLPVPDDSRIEIVEVPAHKSVVLRYSGYDNAEKVEKNKALLLEYLKRDGQIVSGVPRGAGYNPLSAPSFMMCHEIFVEVE